MRLVDIVVEASKSLAANRARATATALGTVVGVAALVAIVGLASTAERQVTDRFDLLEATEVLARSRDPGDLTSAEERVRQLDHVLSSGSFGSGGITDVAVVSLATIPVSNVEIVFATPGFFEAREVTIRNGRVFDTGHVSRGDRVAVLGSDLADRLGATGLPTARAVQVGDASYQVIGIIEDSTRMPSLNRSVVLPLTESEQGRLTEVSIVALADLGFASAIANVMGLAISPYDPEKPTVVSPPRPGDFAVEIREDVRSLVVGAGFLALVLGVMGIASATAVSVVERTSEIGLRMALGAKRLNIAAQIMVESVIIGLWSGVMGAAVGVLAIVGIASARGWQPVVAYEFIGGALLVGLIVGLLAGFVPAWRASSITPDRALRTD